jgi:hypothetical protein
MTLVDERVVIPGGSFGSVIASAPRRRTCSSKPVSRLSSKTLPWGRCAGMVVVLSLDAQSRHLVDLVPLVVVFTTVAVQHRLRKLVVAFAVVTLAASKVWLPISHGRFPYRGLSSTSWRSICS